MQEERRFYNKVRSAILKKFGNRVFFFKTSGDPIGIPDIVGCINGAFFGIELKTKFGKQSKIQKHIENKILQAKGHYICSSSLIEIMRFLEELEKGDRK